MKVFYDEDTYRVIEINGKDTLDNLSNAILNSFNFTHEHMYLFSMDDNPYGDNTYQLNANSDKSTNVSINDIKLVEEQFFLYLYDFGGEWMFSILVEKISSESKYNEPKVLESKGKLEQYPDEDEDYF
ncbi:MAG: plasmid pRiA4b ORF-3 family protein [Methanobrevibacter sp.]|nr:plasmid pRiA4b ORF-3 family protein [Candidatus Methanovirga meridionalis]